MNFPQSLIAQAKLVMLSITAKGNEKHNENSFNNWLNIEGKNTAIYSSNKETNFDRNASSLRKVREAQCSYEETVQRKHE